MIKPRETFHFSPPVEVEEDWMISLTDLEEYNSIYKLTEENKKLQFYKFPDKTASGVSYKKVRDEIEKDLRISDITATDIQDDIKCPINIEEYREQVTKRMKDDKYMPYSAMYIDSVLQDFEVFLRTQVDLV